MSDNEENSTAAAAGAASTTTSRASRTANNAIKLQHARALLPAEMSAFNQRVFEDMQPANGFKGRIKAVTIRNPDVRSFANASGANVIANAVKEVNDRIGKVPEDVAIAERAWELAVLGTWDDYESGYVIVGYTVAPTRDTINRPEFFRPFPYRQLGHLHAKKYDKKAHLRDGRDDHKVPVTLKRKDGSTFQWITNDPRFSPFSWWQALKVPPELMASDAAEAAAAATSSPAKSAAVVVAVEPLSPAQELARRTKAAGHELKQLLDAPGSTFAFWNYDDAHKAPKQLYTPLRLTDKERIPVFPPDFALDIEKLRQQVEKQGTDGRWESQHIVRALLLTSGSTMTSYPFQTFVRYEKENGPALRSNKVDEIIKEFQRDEPFMKTNAAQTAVEPYTALEKLIFLATQKSPLFRHARPLIVAATLTKSIQRLLLHQKFVPTDEVVVCAISLEALEVDDLYMTLDLELMENEAGLTRVTLFIKETCTAFPLVAPPPPMADSTMTKTATKRPAPAPSADVVEGEPKTKKARTRPSLSKKVASPPPPPPPPKPKVGTHKVLDALDRAVDMSSPLWERFELESKKVVVVGSEPLAIFIEALKIKEKEKLSEWTKKAGVPKLNALRQVIRFFIGLKDMLSDTTTATAAKDAMDVVDDDDDALKEFLALAPPTSAPPHEFTSDWSAVPILVDLADKLKDLTLNVDMKTIDPLYVHAFAALFLQ